MNSKVIHMDLTMLVFATYLFAMLSGYGRITNIIAAGLMLVVLFICLNRTIKMSVSIKSSIQAFLLFYLFYAITSFCNYQDIYYLFSTCLVYTLIVFSPIFMQQYWSQQQNFRRVKLFFAISSIIWFIIIISSIVFFISSPDGGREYVNEHRGNILGGGYCAAYASALLAVVLFEYLLSMRKSLSGKAKSLLIFGLIISCVHVFYTMSAITLIAMITGLILVLLYHYRKAQKRSLRSIIITSVVLIALVLFMVKKDDIGYWMIQISDSISNITYAQRLEELGRLFYSGDASHHVLNRLYTLTTSWETFLENPIIGVGYKYGNTYTLLYQNGVGVHSELIDSLAKHGIIGAIPFVLIFYYQIRRIIRLSKIEIAVPLVVTFSILFVFNPFLSAQTMFMLFLYIPLFITIIQKKIA